MDWVAEGQGRASENVVVPRGRPLASLMDEVWIPPRHSEATSKQPLHTSSPATW